MLYGPRVAPGPRVIGGGICNADARCRGRPTNDAARDLFVRAVSDTAAAALSVSAPCSSC